MSVRSSVRKPVRHEIDANDDSGPKTNPCPHHHLSSWTTEGGKPADIAEGISGLLLLLLLLRTPIVRDSANILQSDQVRRAGWIEQGGSSLLRDV